MIVIMLVYLSEFFDTHGGTERRLRADAYLFHRDDAVSYLYYVVEGEVQLIRHQETGEAIVLQRALTGDIVAEASVFSTGYHCDAVAHTDTIIRGLAKTDFLKWFREDPDFAQAWASHLARQVQSTRLRSEILSLKTVADRLDAWLAWHGALPQKGEWNLLALQIAVSPEALYRELSKRRK